MFNDIMIIVTYFILFIWFAVLNIIVFIMIPNRERNMKNEIKKLKNNQIIIIEHIDNKILQLEHSQK